MMAQGIIRDTTRIFIIFRTYFLCSLRPEQIPPLQSIDLQASNENGSWTEKGEEDILFYYFETGNGDAILLLYSLKELMW